MLYRCLNEENHFPFKTSNTYFPWNIAFWGENIFFLLVFATYRLRQIEIRKSFFCKEGKQSKMLCTKEYRYWMFRTENGFGEASVFLIFNTVTRIIIKLSVITMPQRRKPFSVQNIQSIFFGI